MTRSRLLSAGDHSRDAGQMRYVYPVVSRRARGLSIGINLNTNNACNWRCLYCQVPDLARGAAPRVDLGRLESELRQFLDQVLRGDFMQKRVPAGLRRLNDIALSGNGEPTSAQEFGAVIDLIARLRGECGLAPEVRTVLITNGSLMGRGAVRRGVEALASISGEVWFKLDRATKEGMLRVNGASMAPGRVLNNLGACAALCPTWLQTCVFELDGVPPPEQEIAAWLELVGEALRRGVELRGVLLYSLARPSMQPEAPRLAPVSEAWAQAFAARIRATGLPVLWTP